MHKLLFNYGEDVPLPILHPYNQQLGIEKLTWPGKLTGLMLQRQCTFYFRTSSWTRLRCLPIMAITLKRFWIQYLGDRPLLIFSCGKLSLFYIHIFPFILFALFTLHLLWKAWGMCQRCKAHHHSWDTPAVGSCMRFVFWDRKATGGTYLSIIPWHSQRTLPSIWLPNLVQVHLCSVNLNSLNWLL